MKKEIIDIDKTKGIIRVTTQDERWYGKLGKSSETGLPEHKFYPSSTWIVHYYYTSPFLIEWIAKKGLDEADAIKQAAGEKGSKIHQGTEMLDKGEEITINQKFHNFDKNTDEEISFEEYEALIAYKNWFEKTDVQVLATEMTVFNDKYGYAGTLDKIIAIKNPVMPTIRQIYILDIKTSKQISEGHKMQISSYSHADINYKSMGITDEEWSSRKLCILQLSYPYNKDKYKFTEVEDCFPDFINVCMRTWKKNNEDASPKQIFLPMSIKLNGVVKKDENVNPRQTDIITQLEEKKLKVEPKKVEKTKK